MKTGSAATVRNNPITSSGTNAVIETKPKYKTIWYEIEVLR